LRPDFAGLDYVASPMHRTRETMELMRGAMGLDPAAYARDDRLKELTFGSWEGLRWKDVRSKDPQGAAARERDKWGFVPPAARAMPMLTERVRSFVEGLARDTVVVAHGRRRARLPCPALPRLDPARPRVGHLAGQAAGVRRPQARVGLTYPA
jgi:probable phosphoglycerate mutase